MLSLTQNLQDHTRSFLSFKEIHRTRCVCEQWRDIENVPKVLHMLGTKEIPSHASFTRITSFTMINKRANGEALLHRILQQNRRHLLSLSLRRGFVAENPYFPQLPSLQTFQADCTINREVIKAILSCAPNLRQLAFKDVGFEIDVSLWPKLRELTVPNASNVKNIDAGNISKITFTAVWNIADIAQVLTMPSLEVGIQIYEEVSQRWFFSLHSTSKTLSLKTVDDIEQMGDDLIEYCEKFKEVVSAIKSIRDTPISIDPGSMNFAKRKELVLENAFFLAKTGMFKGKEELEMVQQALNKNS